MVRRISRHIMRVALLLMLFQFFAPSFFPFVVQGIPNIKETNYHVQHNSIVAPLLLKEKDEKEKEETTAVSSLTPILDFTDHSLNLTATHARNQNYFHTDQGYDLHPALFKRHCTFLI
jgi:hypothetical protein